MKTTDTTLSNNQSLGDAGKMWRPVRVVAPVSTSGDQIQRLQVQVASIRAAGGIASAPVVVSPDAPAQVTDLVVTTTPKNLNGTLKLVVAASFTTGVNFAVAQVWFTGYNGANAPQLMFSATGSPAEFLCDPTGESVTVTVVAANSAGATAPISAAPTALVALTAAGTAPPAPTINSPTVALPGAAGWQFSWNILGGLLTDVINGYWVYRSSVNVVPTAPTGRYQFFSQPASNLGSETFQDYVSGTYYYWVTAVSVSGRESAFTPAAAADLTVHTNPTTSTGDYNSAASAYDGNETTSADAAAVATPSTGSFHSHEETWSGFANVTGTITAVSLDVMSYARVTGNASVQLFYKLDSGPVWTTIYTLLVTDGSSDSYERQYVSIPLPPAQDLTQVSVRAVCWAQTAPPLIPYSTATSKVFEIHTTVTYTP